MNCQEALNLLYEIIDKEASEIDTKQVEEHLKNCRNCFEIYRMEQAIHDFLNEKTKNYDSSVSLDRLKSKVVKKLDEIDKGESPRGQTHFFNLGTKMLVAAASLVLLIAGGFYLSKFYNHSKNFLPLEKAHWAVAQNINTFKNDDLASQESKIKKLFHYNLSENISNYTLLGGHPENIMGVEMMHFIYSNGNNLISVFIAPADKFFIPSSLKSSGITKDQITFYDHNCRGCRLVYHKVNSSIIITASTNHDFDLLDFIPELTAI